MKKSTHLLPTHEAAQRAGVHITTVKRWARKLVDSGEDVPIKVDQLVTCEFRYLIDGEFFGKTFPRDHDARYGKRLQSGGPAVLAERYTN